MDLIYAEKFWDFYLKNAEAIRKLLMPLCNEQAIRMDPKDMYSMLLLRLDRSDFLKKFDPTVSKLSTWFCNHAYRYIQHIITKNINEKSFIKSVVAENRTYLKQFYVKGLNGYEKEEDLDNYIELDSDARIEPLYEAKEIVVRIIAKLNKTEKTILKMVYLDRIPIYHVMENLGCSRKFVEAACSRIKHIAYALVRTGVEV